MLPQRVNLKFKGHQGNQRTNSTTNCRPELSLIEGTFTGYMKTNLTFFSDEMMTFKSFKYMYFLSYVSLLYYIVKSLMH